MGARATTIVAALAEAALIAAGCGAAEAALIAAGCGAAEEPEEPAAAPPDEPPAGTEAPEADPPAAEADTAACSNPEAGYAVEYPADWYANEDDALEPCSLFHPEPIDAEAVDPQPVAVSLVHEVVSYDEATAEHAGREVTAIGEAEIAGRPATRLAYRGTGEEALPEGVRGYSVVVDVGDGTTLIGSTHENGHDFDRSREVLDGIMDSLVLDS